jgi:hypothetical protein
MKSAVIVCLAGILVNLPAPAADLASSQFRKFRHVT